MNARKNHLDFESVDSESDWTIRLRKDKLDQLGLVIRFDGDTERWALVRYRRVPNVRAIPISERSRLWNRKWEPLTNEEFGEFDEVRTAAREATITLMNQGYEISGIASSSYDLPPW